MFSTQVDDVEGAGSTSKQSWFEQPYVDPLFLSLLIVAGFLLRYFSMPLYQVIAADGPSYIAIAKEIITNYTAHSSIHYPPFYPFLIALGSFFTNDFEFAGVIISLVMGSLLVVPVFLLAKEFFGRAAGYAAAGITLVWPQFVSLSGVVLSTATYITLLVSGLYFLWRAFSKERYLPALSSALLLAAAYLTRQEAFISLSVICFFLSVAVWFKDRSFRRLKPLVVTFGLFVILVFPYIQMVHEIMGIWTLAGKSVVTLKDCLAQYLQRPDLNRDPSFGNIGYMDLIRMYPGYFPYNISKNLIALYEELPLPLIAFSLIGLFSIKRTSRLEIQLFSVAAILPIVVLIVLFFVSGAYVSPYVPFLSILCANGLVCTESYVTGKFFKTFQQQKNVYWITAVVIVIYVVKMAISQIPHESQPPYTPEMDGGRYAHKLIGKMLKKNLPEGAVIMTRSSRIGFYSEHTWVNIPQADMQSIVKTALDNNVRYLVVDGNLLFQRPQLGNLLTPLLEWKKTGLEVFEDSKATYPGFYMKLIDMNPATQGVVVYEFKR